MGGEVRRPFIGCLQRRPVLHVFVEADTLDVMRVNHLALSGQEAREVREVHTDGWSSRCLTLLVAASAMTERPQACRQRPQIPRPQRTPRGVPGVRPTLPCPEGRTPTGNRGTRPLLDGLGCVQAVPEAAGFGHAAPGPVHRGVRSRVPPAAVDPDERPERAAVDGLRSRVACRAPARGRP